MKKFITALILLSGILVFSSIHAWKISELTNEIRLQNDEIYTAVQREEWEAAVQRLEEVQQTWDKSRLWISITIPSPDIEELEISLKQSVEYAKAQDISGFVGEFIMFRQLLLHLPHHEGFDVEEIL